MSGYIKAPLTGFKPGSYTVIKTNISGGTQTELKGIMNDALGQVIIFDAIVTVVGSQVTMNAHIAVDATNPVRGVANFAGTFSGTLQAKDSQGRTPVKSAARNVTYLITPKTIPGVHAGAVEADALNAMLKAKGLM